MRCAMKNVVKLEGSVEERRAAGSVMKACLDVGSVLLIMTTLGAITLGMREETI